MMTLSSTVKEVVSSASSRPWSRSSTRTHFSYYGTAYPGGTGQNKSDPQILELPDEFSFSIYVIIQCLLLQL